MTTDRDFARILKPGETDPVKTYALQDVAVLTDGGGSGADTLRQAYEKGIAAGEQRAKDASVLLLEEQNRLLTRLIEELKHLHASILTDTEDMIAGLAVEVASKVIRRQIAELPEMVVEQVREAVGRVKEGGPIRVLVHPEDAPLVQAAREAIEKTFEGTVSLQIEPRPTITRGGCQVETPARLVDARIEVQLARLGDALRRRELVR
ncbi:MAG TPA: FliH/SctL family protein [Nitrospirales bacterium]|nr:FliH/SctL family protein [Nitrospirales bacterium]